MLYGDNGGQYILLGQSSVRELSFFFIYTRRVLISGVLFARTDKPVNCRLISRLYSIYKEVSPICCHFLNTVVARVLQKQV